MKLVLSLLIVALCATVALAEDNHWQGDPAATGDWFDPACWTLGVPTENHSAYIQNGGKASVHANDAFAKYVFIGNTSSDPVSSSTGAIMQTGGNMKIENYMYLTGPMDTPGTYTMTGGALESRGIQVGQYIGSGLFTQIGGNNTTYFLTVGGTSYFSNIPNCLDTLLGTYEMIGGQLTTQQSDIGTEGRGRFIQTGGIHEVSDTLTIGGPYQDILLPSYVIFPTIAGDLDFIPNMETYGGGENGLGYRPIHPICPSDGRYELNGGLLKTKDEVIRKTGELRQTGGQHVVDYLTVISGGKYAMSGGTLEIQSGLEMDGELDLQGSAVEIQGSGILNFGQGQLLNSQNASIHAGSNSLTILPKDFDPATQLGNIQSDGLVHVSGNDLIIQTNDTIIGRGVIDDHVETSGQIIAAEGKGIDINGGLLVHKGVVDLGDGVLTYDGDVKKGRGDITIQNQRSGIEDGSITARSMTIGSSSGWIVNIGGEYPNITTDPTGKFRQSGGTVNLSNYLEVTRGSYELHRGVCNVENYVRVGYVFPWISVLTNQGGSVNTLITEPTAHVDFNTPDIPDEFVSQPYSTFEVHGGKLTTPSLYITGDCQDANFIQTAGEVMIQDSVSIQGNGSNQACYTMYGGTLKTTLLNLGCYYSCLADSSVSSGDSMLAILGSSAQIQTNVLGFYENSAFTAVPGSSIHITEAQDETSVSTSWNPGVYISNTDPAAMSGLSNLTLLYECGLESVAILEVAGEDRGDGYAGFFENFALDTLQIGSEDGDAYVRLWDNFDNQLDWNGEEVLYVENLFLAEGSTLDLNGLNVYCLNCTIEGTLISGGGALYLNGAMITPTINPEPATAGLLIVGGLLLTVHRKKRRAER